MHATQSSHRVHTLTTGLVMGESPRKHDGRLWLSDMGAREVVAVDLAGTKEVVARVPTGLTGIGFRPDGHMLILPPSGWRLHPSHLIAGRATV